MKKVVLAGYMVRLGCLFKVDGWKELKLLLGICVRVDDRETGCGASV